MLKCRFGAGTLETFWFFAACVALIFAFGRSAASRGLVSSSKDLPRRSGAALSFSLPGPSAPAGKT